METRYVFSLNGSDWSGEFKTRKEARQAAIDLGRQQPELPGVVYVGKAVPADTQAMGHARDVIKAMSDRAEQMGHDHYLVGVKVEQVRKLDQELARTINAWLIDNHLEPKQYKVEAISEYPVPMPSESNQVRQTQMEISDLGPGQQL